MAIHLNQKTYNDGYYTIGNNFKKKRQKVTNLHKAQLQKGAQRRRGKSNYIMSNERILSVSIEIKKCQEISRDINSYIPLYAQNILSTSIKRSERWDNAVRTLN